MRVIGPASLGIVNTNPAVSLNASMAPALARRGGLGLFSQSAAIGVSLYAAVQPPPRRHLHLPLRRQPRRRLRQRHDAVLGGRRRHHRASGLYLESIGNPRKFSRLARRLARTKPVIVAKSDAMGLNLPPGHAVRTTQAPPEALDAMMRQAGVIRVETIEELMDVAQIVSSQPLPTGPGIAVFSNSRALGKVVADSAAAPGARGGTDRRPTSTSTPGMSRALPALRRSLQETLTRGHRARRGGRAASGARAHRRKDRRRAGRMFRGGRQAGGRRLQRNP